MTNETDKLPALAGLAAAYGTATGKSYIVGLWKESLLNDLLWQQYWLSRAFLLDIGFLLGLGPHSTATSQNLALLR